MADEPSWLDLKHAFQNIEDDRWHPLRAEHVSAQHVAVEWPFADGRSPVPGVIADAAHWRIVDGGKDTAGQFVAVAALAARKLGHPGTEWWRWLDVLQAHGEAVADDEPVNITEPESDTIIDTIAIGTIYLLDASANEAARQAMAAVVSQSSRAVDNRPMVAANLDRLRIRCGLSPYALADKMGIDKRLCAQHLRGERTPSPEMVLRYAKLFADLGHAVHADVIALRAID